MKVAVLCGGKGTRLGLTDRPKPMVPLAGKPLLERLVDVAKASGFQEFVFLNGHLADVIEDHFGDGSAFGVSITHIRESEPRGTAGAFLDARSVLREPFIALYGDILLDIDLAHFAHFHLEKGGIGSVFVHPNDHPFDSDLVDVDSDNKAIRRFLPKPHPARTFLPNLVSAAVYVLDPRTIDYVSDRKPSDWVHDVFPRILESGQNLYAYRSFEYAKDIGTADRLKKAEKDIFDGKLARLSRRNAKPAIFFDRDGVLNKEIGGVHRPEQLVLNEGAAQAVRATNKAGVPSICITNQPDIAKGFFTPEDLAQVFSALDTALAKEDAYLDDAYYCPHHPERGWPEEVTALKIRCDCRKPEPGLLLRAASDHNIDLSRSWMIGDRNSDVDAAHAVGAKAVLLSSNDEAAAMRGAPDHVAPNVLAAVTHILGRAA